VVLLCAQAGNVIWQIELDRRNVVAQSLQLCCPSSCARWSPTRLFLMDVSLEVTAGEK
jgi:hypothetical protein